MDKRLSKARDKDQKSVTKPKSPRCLAVAEKGITTANEFAQFMSGLMTDIIEGSVTPPIANATVNAGGKLLKVVEMQLRYGEPTPKVGKALQLVRH